VAKKKREPVKPPASPFTIREYESSPYWAKKSKEILDNKEAECAICHRKRWHWQVRNKAWKRVMRGAVHHIRYDNVPNEESEDLLVMCYQCHDFCHSVIRLANMSPMYREMAELVKKYGFLYEKTAQKIF